MTFAEEVKHEQSPQQGPTGSGSHSLPDSPPVVKTRTDDAMSAPLGDFHDLCANLHKAGLAISTKALDQISALHDTIMNQYKGGASSAESSEPSRSKISTGTMDELLADS